MTVALVVRFVRHLGGGDAAAIVAGLAVATAPIFLGLADTLNTTAFEPLAWTIVFRREMAFGIALVIAAPSIVWR